MIGEKAGPLLETLDLLMSLNRNGARPPEARAAVRSLEERHGTRIDLLWLEERHDGSLHYDALLAVPGGTVSLSYCPDRALPWPLRGVQRWADRDLARVDGIVLEVPEALLYIDFVSGEQRVTDRLLDACVVRAELNRNPAPVTNDELQTAMDAFRRGRGLHTAAETKRWMELRGLTQERLESILTERVETEKLRHRLTSGSVDGYFEAHRADFDVARFARIEVRGAEEGRLLAAEIRAGAGFLESAGRCFHSGSATPASREVFVSLRRREARGALGDAVFAAGPGDLVGPIQTDTGVTVAWVLAREQARLDGETREAIQRILFEEWLSERRSAASVEWYWGYVQQHAAKGA